MANVNVDAPADQAPTMAPPTRTDDQILPHIRWVPIGKSNCYLDVERSQSNPIYKIVVDILKHTNFFRAFTTSSTISSIYIQQFWDTVRFDKTEYLTKVAKHQRYLVGKKGSDPDSPILKPAKATKKSKPSAPKADLRPPVTKPASSQQPEPKPAPAKSQGKKLKLVTKMSDKPSPARRSKPGLVTKRRKPTSSLRSVDESVDEGIPEKEPRFDDEEADIQMAVAKSLKSVYDAPRVSQPQSSPVVHAGPNLEHTNLEATDVLTQLHPDQMDEGFTATAYPNVQENLKLTVEEQVILEEPNVHRPLQATEIETTTITTTTKTTHLPPPQPQQSTTDSMLIKSIGELEQIMANLIQDNKYLEERLDSYGACQCTLENLDMPQQVSKAVDEIVSDAVDWAIQAPLRNRFRDLPEADMKEILYQLI
nr:hypothetical protein [Tanacetum cinerariifolium]